MYRHKSVTIIVLLVFLTSLIVGLSACQKKVVSEPKKKTAAEIALETAYEKQNLALAQSKNSSKFGKLSPNPEALNPDGVYVPVYIQLAGYHKYTGKTITYQQLLDYLSSEYESDGTIRIYNNGRHPEIADYVDWAYSHQEQLAQYWSDIVNLSYKYYPKTQNDQTADIGHWNTAAIDELIKKEADPNYQLNLLAIQQQEAAKSAKTTP